MRKTSRWLALGLVGALAFAACADDKKEGVKTDASDSTKPTAAPSSSTTVGALTDLGHGVSATEIKVGIALIDFDTIADFVDFKRGDQEAIAQAFIDDVNDSGGVLGRKLVPVYKKYIPIGSVFATTTCTEFTDDEDVFAVLGIVIDNTGQSQLCLSEDKETVHIGHELRNEWLTKAGGLMLTPDGSIEGRINALFKFLDRESKLGDEAMVATLTDQNSAALVESVVNPALEDLGVATGTGGVLTIANEDTTEAQAQLDTLLTAWENEGINTLVMTSENVVSKQFVQKIKTAFPEMQLIAAVDTGVRGAAQDEVAAGTDPNPYEGILNVAGIDEVERWESEKLQACKAVWETASGETVDGPADAKVVDGDRDETYVAVTDFCGEIGMFVTIAEQVGADLTTANWMETVNGFGPIEVIPTENATLGDGKYAADDALALVEWDSTLSEGKGGWNYLTEVEDITQL